VSLKFTEDDAIALMVAVQKARPGLAATARVVDHDTVLLLDVHNEEGRTVERAGVKADGAPLAVVLGRFLKTLESVGA
jgi:hypothetical protein